MNGVQALPRITPLTTGAFQWRTLDLQVLSQDDPVEILRNLIPEPNQRRQTLARVLASGHCRLARHAALVAQAEDLSPDFAWFELDMDGLASSMTSTTSTTSNGAAPCASPPTAC